MLSSQKGAKQQFLSRSGVQTSSSAPKLETRSNKKSAHDKESVGMMVKFWSISSVHFFMNSRKL